MHDAQGNARVEQQALNRIVRQALDSKGLVRKIHYVKSSALFVRPGAGTGVGAERGAETSTLGD